MKKRKVFFPYILIGSTLILAYCFWKSFVLLPYIWHWPIVDIRTSFRGSREQSVFTFFSLIPAIGGGIFLADFYNRGWQKASLSLLLVPYLAAWLAIFEMRGFEAIGHTPDSSTFFHLNLFLLWFLNACIYFLIRKWRKSKATQG